MVRRLLGSDSRRRLDPVAARTRLCSSVVERLSCKQLTGVRFLAEARYNVPSCTRGVVVARHLAKV